MNDEFNEYTLTSVKVSRSLTIHATFKPIGWATYVIDDDQGTLSITSDWGDWAYRWGRGKWIGVDPPDLSLALKTRFDIDYVANKLDPNRQAFSWDKTQKELHRLIAQARRKGELSKEDARDAWDSLNYDLHFEEMLSTIHEHSVLNSLFGDDTYYSAEYVDTSRFISLKQVVLPALKKILRQENEDVRTAAAAEVR